LLFRGPSLLGPQIQRPRNSDESYTKFIKLPPLFTDSVKQLHVKHNVETQKKTQKKTTLLSRTLKV